MRVSSFFIAVLICLPGISLGPMGVRAEELSKSDTTDTVQIPRSDGANCVAPTTDCEMIKIINAQLDSLKAAIQEDFKNGSGDLTQGQVACYLEAANRAYQCFPKDCGLLNFEARREIGSNWNRTVGATFTGDPGHCIFDAAATRGSASIVSPANKQVFNALTGSTLSIAGSISCDIVDRNPKEDPPNASRKEKEALAKHRAYSSRFQKSSRAFKVTPNSLVVIDWVDGKNVSAHRGKSITLSGISPNEAMPKLIPVDENTLKVLWSNGASLDLKEDGTPKSSNFLPDGFFSPAACRTGSEKSHFSPEIKVLNSQSFTKDIDPLIK